MVTIKDIVQHHDSFDFTPLFYDEKEKYIGIDCNDTLAFLCSGNEIHSFIGRAGGENRVKRAIDAAVSTVEAAEVMHNAVSAMLTVIYSPQAERSLTVVETQYISEFVRQLPCDCCFFWNVLTDTSLGNEIRAVVLFDIIKQGSGL